MPNPILVLTLALLIPLSAQADTCLRLGLSDLESPALALFEVQYQEALRKAGYCVVMQRVPVAREAELIRAGNLDGAAARVLSYSQLVGDGALHVPVPVGFSTGNIISFDPALNSLNRKVLNGRRIGIASGTKWQMDVTSHLQDHQVHVSADNSHLIQLLDSGRVDAILMIPEDFALLRPPSRPVSSSPIVNLKVFTWLARKHKDMVPQFTKLFSAAITAQGHSFTEPPWANEE